MEDRKEIVLSKEFILKNGIDFDRSLCYGGQYGEFIVKLDEDGNEIPYTGITYILFPDGNIDMYMHVKDGIKEGELVEFYPNGNVKRILSMMNNTSEGRRIGFYEDGSFEYEEERLNGFLMTYTRYDKQGNIIDQKLKPTDEEIEIARTFE